MADDLGAVLEAPEVVADGAAEQVNEQQAEQQAVETQTEQASEEIKGDERVLPAYIRTLKATDPAAFREAKRTFFEHRTYGEKLKDFDLDGAKQLFDERGGRESLIQSLTSLEGKAAEYDGLMQKIAEGSTDVLKDIPQEALVKLAPAVAEQWAQSDPEGWGAAMSSVFASTLQQNGIPMFLERLSMNLEFGKTEEVQKMVDQLKGWAGSFAEKAQAARTTQPQAGKTQQPDVNTERQQWEAQKFNDGLRTEVDSFRTPLIDAQLKPFYARRAGDTDAQNLAKSTVANQVIDRMAEDRDFQKALNGLVARKDKEGAMRLIKSRETTAINEIAPKVGRMIFGNPAPTTKTDADRKAETQQAERRTAKPQPVQDPKDAILQRIFAR